MNRQTRILEHVFKNEHTRKIINIEDWIQNDSLFLHEGICLIFEREAPLEDVPITISIGMNARFTQQSELIDDEYRHALNVFYSAIRSIQSGDLVGGSNNENDYWVSFDDLLRWSYERSIGNESHIKMLMQKRVEIRASRKLLPPTNGSKTYNHVSPSEEILDKNAKDIFNDTNRDRMQITEIILNALFPEDSKSYLQYAHLIEESKLPEEEFTKYNKKGKPTTLEREHQTRAACKALKAIFPKLKISEIERHGVLSELQLRGEKPSSSKFREWLNREGIYDRQPKKLTNHSEYNCSHLIAPLSSQSPKPLLTSMISS